jgi:hypothetical protein
MGQRGVGNWWESGGSGLVVVVLVVGVKVQF